MRTAEGLVEAIATLAEPVDWGDPLRACATIADSPTIVEIEHEDLGPSESGLIALWNSARRPRAVGPDVVAQCLRLLDETVLDETVLDRPRAAGAIALECTEAPRVRATARHPRAYEGTHERLPKPPAPAPLVLSEVMLDHRAERDLLRQSRHLVGHALQEAPPRRRRRLARVLPPDCRAGVGGFDEKLFALTGFDGAALTPRVRAYLWPQLRDMSAAQIARVVALSREAEQDLGSGLLEHLAWWLASQADEDAICWLEWAFSLSSEHREIALACTWKLRADAACVQCRACPLVVRCL